MFFFGHQFFLPVYFPHQSAPFDLNLVVVSAPLKTPFAAVSPPLCLPLTLQHLSLDQRCLIAPHGQQQGYHHLAPTSRCRPAPESPRSRVPGRPVRGDSGMGCALPGWSWQRWCHPRASAGRWPVQRSWQRWSGG